MPIFSADTWFLSGLTDSYIPRRWNDVFFSGNLSTGTGLVINKININSYQICNGNVEGRLSPGISKMSFHGVFKRHWNKLPDDM